MPQINTNAHGANNMVTGNILIMDKTLKEVLVIDDDIEKEDSTNAKDLNTNSNSDEDNRYLFIYLFIYLFVCLFIGLFICLYIYYVFSKLSFSSWTKPLRKSW